MGRRRLWHNWRLNDNRRCNRPRYGYTGVQIEREDMRRKRSSIGLGPLYPGSNYDDALDSWAVRKPIAEVH